LFSSDARVKSEQCFVCIPYVMARQEQRGLSFIKREGQQLNGQDSRLYIAMR